MGSENDRVVTIVEMVFIYARMSIWPTQYMMVIIFGKVRSLLFKLIKKAQIILHLKAKYNLL